MATNDEDPLEALTSTIAVANRLLLTESGLPLCISAVRIDDGRGDLRDVFELLPTEVIDEEFSDLTGVRRCGLNDRPEASLGELQKDGSRRRLGGIGMALDEPSPNHACQLVVEAAPLPAEVVAQLEHASVLAGGFGEDHQDGVVSERQTLGLELALNT